MLYRRRRIVRSQAVLVGAIDAAEDRVELVQLEVADRVSRVLRDRDGHKRLAYSGQLRIADCESSGEGCEGGAAHVDSRAAAAALFGQIAEKRFE